MIGEIDLSKAVRNIILGTDWWTDCDDCVAVRVLCDAHKKGLVNFSGVYIDACADFSIESLDAFIRLEGLKNIPIGLDRAATDFSGKPKFQRPFVEKYNDYVQTYDNTMPAVSLCRKLLSQAEGLTDIVEIGFNQVLVELMDSEPDSYSQLNGYELIKEKVGKLWCMAGDFGPYGAPEHNFCNNERSRKAGKELCDRFPVPITFLGHEIGRNVITGDKLEENDFLYDIMNFQGSPRGRCSWDPMTVLCAVIGDEKKAGYTYKQGKVTVDENSGKSYFTEAEDGPHRYLIFDRPYAYYADAINAIIDYSER